MTRHNKMMGGKEAEYKPKSDMIDNRMVKENHQQGIERVIQRKGDLDVGQGGKMANKPEQPANWKRGDSLTPRRG
jgi:hypothetical protein